MFTKSTVQIMYPPRKHNPKNKTCGQFYSWLHVNSLADIHLTQYTSTQMVMHTCLCAIPVGFESPVGEWVVRSELQPQSVAMWHYDGWTTCSTIFTNQRGCFIASISVKEKKVLEHQKVIKSMTQDARKAPHLISK